MYTDITYLNTVSLTGRGLNPQRPETEDRSKAVLQVIFVPWEDIVVTGAAEESLSSVFDAMLSSNYFSERTLFHMQNLNLLRNSAEGCALDRQNFKLKLYMGHMGLDIDNDSQEDNDAENVVDDRSTALTIEALMVSV